MRCSIKKIEEFLQYVLVESRRHLADYIDGLDRTFIQDLIKYMLVPLIIAL